MIPSRAVIRLYGKKEGITMKTSKRILALCLVVVMVFTMLPMQVFAAIFILSDAETIPLSAMPIFSLIPECKPR